MLLTEAGRHPHPAPESEPAPKRPHVLGSPDDAAPGHRAAAIGAPARPAARAKDQGGHHRHRGAAAGTNRVVGAAAAIASGAAAAKDQSGGVARRGSPPAPSAPAPGAAAPAAEVAALTAGVFARLASREATPPEAQREASGDAAAATAAAADEDADTARPAATEELEAAAEAAVAAGGHATAPAVASAAARRAGPNGRGALPPITPCSSLADPASAQGQLAEALIRAAARCSPAASPSPFDGGSPEPQGSASGGDAGAAVASTPPRPPPPSAAGSSQTGGGSAAGARGVAAHLGSELRQREGSGLREPPSTPATKSGNFAAAAASSEGLPFARSLPETPPTTPAWPSTANNLQQWGSGRLGRDGSCAGASGAASGGAGSGAETPGATATSGPTVASRGGSNGGGRVGPAPAGVDSEQLRTAMRDLAVGGGKEWDEERGDERYGAMAEVGQQDRASSAAAPPPAAAGAEGLARPIAAAPAANGLPPVANGLPGGVAALPQPAPVPRGPVTPSVSRRLPAEIPAIPEDAAVTAPPLPPACPAAAAAQPGGAAPQTIAEEGNGSSHGTGDSACGSASAAGEGGGAPLPALPFVRVSSAHSAASAALEEALLHSVPLDEMALRSASRGGTPRAGSVSYASSTASSQDRPDLAELAAFGGGGGGGGGHVGVCVAGGGSFRGHHRLASSSGRSRSRSPSPSPFAGDAVQRGVRAQLGGGRSWSSGGGEVGAAAAAAAAAAPAADGGVAAAAAAAAAAAKQASGAPTTAAAKEASAAAPAAPQGGAPPPLPSPALLGALGASDAGDAPPRPLLPAVSSPLAPNRCVTELSAAEQARLWDSDAPVAVPQHSAAAGPRVRGATPPGRPPSSLLHRGARGRSGGPWWAAWGWGCLAPRGKYDDDSGAED